MTEPTTRPAEPTVREYRSRYETYAALPTEGHDRDAVLAEMREMADLEAARWADGYASGSVYNGDPDHIDFLNRVYALNSQANPLHTDLWPSAVKYESEIVAMTASMLGAAGIGDGPGTDTGVVRHGVVGRQREHPARHEDLPRPRPRHPGHHRRRR